MIKAETFFQAVKCASDENSRALAQIMSMQETEDVRAQSYSPSIAPGSNSDVMRRVDKRIDMEERLNKRLENNYKLIDIACTVLYGEDQMGHGGLYKLKGDVYADVLSWRYLHCFGWQKLAKRMGMSKSTAQSLVKEALGYVDELELLNDVNW